MNERLSTGLSSSEARKIDETCDRFEAVWKADERPDPAAFLDLPVGLGRDALLRQLLLLDWDYRLQAGDEPRASNYLERFPDDAALIAAIGREMSVSPSTRLQFDDRERHEPVDQFLNRPPEDDSAANRYHLMQEIGHGGIGVVFRARDRHLGRELAIKMLREDYRDHPEARHRFLHEACVGSRLQHPAIVPVYEMGWFDNRTPYLTMRLVEGKTFASLLHGRIEPGRDLPELLGSFEQICHAMAYAHSQRVVHRDLKPANVMVGAFGEVQVMDWGFAKLLDDGEEMAGRTPHKDGEPVNHPGAASNSGVMMGTPAYMPPEQARGESAGIDYRADVFALGAILCEVLTGLPPYVASTPDEVCDLAVRGDLSRAHAALDHCGADEPLRAIARRCLSAERADRPDNAGIVVQELTAYRAAAQERLRQIELARAEATARAETAAAQARVERRAMRLAFMFVVALLAGIGIAIWQVNVANRAKQDADLSARAEREAKQTAVFSADAEREAKHNAEAKTAEKQAILNFVTQHVFAAARPKNRPGGLGYDSTVRQALDAAKTVISRDFTNQPIIEAELCITLAETYRDLGEPVKAIDLLQRALTIYKDLYGREHRRTLETQTELGNAYNIAGKSSQSAELHKEVLEIRKRTLGLNDPSTLKSMNNLALCYDSLGEHGKALLLNQEALDRKTARLGPRDKSTLTTMVNLANSYGKLGQEGRALELRQKAADLWSEAFGPKDYGTLMCQHNLANSYRKFGRFEEALQLDQTVLDRRSDTLGPDHPDTLTSLWSVAKDLVELNRSADAVPYLDRCLRLAVGKTVHPNFAEVADLRLRHFEKLKDASGCRATAQMWERLGRTDSESYYQAARFRAVASAVFRADHASRAAKDESETEATQAMAWLENAVAKGFKDGARLGRDKDFGGLHDRSQFWKLLPEMRKEER